MLTPYPHPQPSTPSLTPCLTNSSLSEQLDLLAVDAAKVKSPEHPHTVGALLGLGALELALLHLDTAHERCQHGGRLCKNAYGMQHPQYARALVLLGRIRSLRDDMEDGIRLIQIAVTTLQAAYGPTHPDTAAALLHASEIELSRSRHSEALRLLNAAVDMQAKAGTGRRSTDSWPEAASVASMLTAVRGDYETALSHLLPVVSSALAVHDRNGATGTTHTHASPGSLGVVELADASVKENDPLTLPTFSSSSPKMELQPADVAVEIAAWLCVAHAAHIHSLCGRYDDAHLYLTTALAHISVAASTLTTTPAVTSTTTTSTTTTSIPFSYTPLSTSFSATGDGRDLLPPSPRRALHNPIPALAQVLFYMSEFFVSVGQFQHAISTAQRAYEIYSQLLGPAHLLATYAHVQAVRVEFILVLKFASARDDLENAMRRFETTLGVNHPFTTDAMYALGLVLLEGGLYNDALELFDKAHAARVVIYGARHPLVADCLFQRASVQRVEGHFDEAMDTLDQVLKIRRGSLGLHHVDVAATLLLMSSILAQMCKFPEAMRCCDEADAVLCKVVPSALTAQTQMTRRSSITEDRGSPLMAFASPSASEPTPPSAQALSRNAESVAATALVSDPTLATGEAQTMLAGDTDPSPAPHSADLPEATRALLCRASIVFAVGDYHDALPLVTQALAMRTRMYGNNHPETARAMEHRARLYHLEGEYIKAVHMYKEALLIIQRCLGASHPDVAVALQLLAAVHGDDAHFDAALELYRKALAIRKMSFGEKHATVADSLASIGTICRLQGHYDEARAMFETALGMRRELLGPNHLDVARTLVGLGNLLCHIHRLDDARRCFDAGVTVCL